MTGYEIGQRVRMTWVGGTRDGVVVGDTAADPLPTGAAFTPVRWDDDATVCRVDDRVLRALASAAL